jgi:diguanylate cyclase (GGDEF)-like protein
VDAISSSTLNSIKIPSLPAIAIRVLEAVKADRESLDSLAGIISSDPALALRTLKLANSSFYCLKNKVDNIQSALSVLGTNTLKNIALSFILSEIICGDSTDCFDFNVFWKRSLTAAVGAQLISSLLGKKDDDYFITGLFQDIGIAISFLCMPREHRRVAEEKRILGKSAIALEKKIMGFDHQELGSQILSQWGLPQNVYMPILYHHENHNAPPETKTASDILFCSGKLSSFYHGKRSGEKIKSVKDVLGNDYGISESDIDQLIDAVASKSTEIISSFDIEEMYLKPYSEILQEANQELAKLNLSNQQLIIELRQSREQIIKLNQQLALTNAELKQMTIKDDLTGLFNRRHFFESLGLEIKRVNRYKKWLSLILFDLDHFKKVNDTFGHQAGDHVLVMVGSMVTKAIRDTDILSRYGGEEFAILLPETELKGAVIFAERVRKCIENAQILYKGRKIKTTVSLGVATYSPSSGTREKEDIVAAADEALYSAKNKGRNRVGLTGEL